jgi:hypothetical protein
MPATSEELHPNNIMRGEENERQNNKLCTYYLNTQLIMIFTYFKKNHLNYQLTRRNN